MPKEETNGPGLYSSESLSLRDQKTQRPQTGENIFNLGDICEISKKYFYDLEDTHQ